MKIQEITKPLQECASAGATGAGAFGISMGNNAGWGNSIFMKRATKGSATTKKKKSKK